MYDANIGRWFVQDPLAEENISFSSYNYVSNNPISRIDYKGLLDDWVENKNGVIYWDEYAYSPETTEEGYVYLGPIVVVFNGSMDERLGEGDNLFGAGAILADVTVYSPKGADDIAHYKGFTMSSDRDRYGVIDNGFYNVTRITDKRSYGPYSTPFAINNKGKVPALGNYNPAYPNRNPAYLNYVYIHNANNNGWAGWKHDNQGIERAVSKGCLLIAPSRYNQNGTIKSIGWDQFSKQLQNVNLFLLHICR